MKSIVAQKGTCLLFVLFFPSILSAQNIPNGGFEEVIINAEFPTDSYPINWMPFHWLPGIECFPFQSQGMLSNESYTGNYAIKMETISCEEVPNGLVHRPSGFYTGNPGMWPPKGWSLEYDNRPEYLNFYYKFHQESNDSAYVEIMLFNYDSLTQDIPSIERVDTIAYSQSNIYDETDEYIEYILPINYISDSLPSFISIIFSSGKKHGCTLSSCTPGTTLWVDDVSVTGGTVGIVDTKNEKLKFSIYPNPSSKQFRILSKNYENILKVSVLSCLGQELKVWNSRNDNYWIGDLDQGTYLIRVDTPEGSSFRRLIKGD